MGVVAVEGDGKGVFAGIVICVCGREDGSERPAVVVDDDGMDKDDDDEVRTAIDTFFGLFSDPIRSGCEFIRIT